MVDYLTKGKSCSGKNMTCQSHQQLDRVRPAPLGVYQTSIGSSNQRIHEFQHI